MSRARHNIGAGDGWFAFVVGDGRAQRRTVELLRRSGRLSAIASGLAPGETVFVYPGDKIAAGVRVDAR